MGNKFFQGIPHSSSPCTSCAVSTPGSANDPRGGRKKKNLKRIMFTSRRQNNSFRAVAGVQNIPDFEFVKWGKAARHEVRPWPASCISTVGKVSLRKKFTSNNPPHTFLLFLTQSAHSFDRNVCYPRWMERWPDPPVGSPTPARLDTTGLCDCAQRCGSDFCVRQRFIYSALVRHRHAPVCEARSWKEAGSV